MIYLLDTNICIYAINDRYPRLTHKILTTLPDDMAISSITVGELEYENFNAASAFVKVRGVGIHPGSAKGVVCYRNNTYRYDLHPCPVCEERMQLKQTKDGALRIECGNNNRHAYTLDKTALARKCNDLSQE